ncbi:ROK family protein [Glutamicibacter endophyticus]
MSAHPQATPALALGIDIGGTGIKGGIVDLGTGELCGERFRIDTPSPATPPEVAEVVGEIYRELLTRDPIVGAQTPVGITFPGIIHHGVARSGANVGQHWVGTDIAMLFAEELGREVLVLNDADAAGLAETEYGAGRNRSGTVLTLTLGTGIGSALVHDGVLVPNFELGHLEIGGVAAEKKASSAARKRDDISWEKYARRLENYLRHVQFLFSPELIILGGGISKKPEKFLPYIELETPIEIARSANNAGIIGAALQAQRLNAH